MDPQQGTGYLPFLKNVSVTEPLRRSLVLEIACDVVIGSRIGRRLPFSKTVSQFPPCDPVRYLTAGDDRSDDERFISSTLYAICRITNFAFIADSLTSSRLILATVSVTTRSQSKFAHH